MGALGEEDRLVTCTVVRGEILFGISRLPDGKRRAELERAAHEILDAFPCEAVPPRAADAYASIKTTRWQRGLSLDENDLWVAATAMTLGATLVSRDRDFSGIDGLPVLSLA